MIALDSPRWSELKHAYGSAGDIPVLLRQLEKFPPRSKYDDEPWFSLWSALCHQGDVYSASFAAVPHVIRVLATDPSRADFSYFQFPAQVEICRCHKNIDVPEDLRAPYLAALKSLPLLVAAASSRDWDSCMLQSVLAALAVAKGFPNVAEAVQELDTQTATKFMKWFYDQ